MRPADVGATSGPVPKVVEYLRHVHDRDLAPVDLLALKVETFTAMAESADRWHDRDHAEACRQVAAEAQEMLDAIVAGAAVTVRQVTSCSR